MSTIFEHGEGEDALVVDAEDSDTLVFRAFNDTPASARLGHTAVRLLVQALRRWFSESIDMALKLDAARAHATYAGRRFRHYKGDVYQVLGVTIDEEIGELRISYRDANGFDWSRTLDNFEDTVDGKPRFELVRGALDFERTPMEQAAFDRESASVRAEIAAARNEPPPEVDLRGGERGKYAARFAAGVSVVASSYVHLAREPFKALCGADESHPWTTNISSHVTCPACLESVKGARRRLGVPEPTTRPTPVLRQAHIRCPFCGARHVDKGKWMLIPHHKHLCASCDAVFRVEGVRGEYFVGVAE